MPVECSINAKIAHLLRAMPSSSISLVLCFPATMSICITLVTPSLASMVMSGTVVIVHVGGMHDAVPVWRLCFLLFAQGQCPEQVQGFCLASYALFLQPKLLLLLI